jgi:hypothetical protein
MFFFAESSQPPIIFSRFLFCFFVNFGLMTTYGMNLSKMIPSSRMDFGKMSLCFLTLRLNLLLIPDNLAARFYNSPIGVTFLTVLVYFFNLIPLHESSYFLISSRFLTIFEEHSRQITLKVAFFLKNCCQESVFQSFCFLL